MKRLEVRPGFVAELCVLYYLSPGAVFWAFLAGAFLHELGHLAALTAFGITITQIRLGALGAVMRTEPMSHPVEAVCALAGPTVNLFCFWALRSYLPGAALVSLLLGCYNLLPVYPLDGGRALRAILSLFLSLHIAEILGQIIAVLTLGGIGLLVAWARGRFGLLPLGLYMLLLARMAANFCCQPKRISV